MTILDFFHQNTEGVLDVGFEISNVGHTPKSDIINPKYTEGVKIYALTLIVCVKT
jgi:hypothetical protein